MLMPYLIGMVTGALVAAGTWLVWQRVKVIEQGIAAEYEASRMEWTLIEEGGVTIHTEADWSRWEEEVRNGAA